MTVSKPQPNQRYKDSHGHRITVVSVEFLSVTFYRDGYEHPCVQPLDRFDKDYKLIAGVRMSNATCQKEAFPLAGNLSKPDIWPWAMLTIDNTTDRKAGGAILTIPKALSAAGHYPVLDNAVMHSFFHAATFAHRVCNAAATGFLKSIKKGGISAPRSMWGKVQNRTLVTLLVSCAVPT